MAGVKISALGTASLPLTGDELVPMVQGGVTVRAPSSSFATRARVLSAIKPIRTIIPFGDSITETSSTEVAPGVWQYGQGWPVNACLTAGLQIIRNAGIAGNTIFQMGARLQTAVIDYAPDACPVAGLTNDMPFASNATMALALNEYESICIRLLAANILPIVVVPPTKDTAAASARTVRPFLYALAKYYGLPLIDQYRVTANPATGLYRSGYSSDGTHPNTTGMVPMTAEAVSVLSALRSYPAAPAYLSAYDETTAGNFQNLARNGCFSRVSSSPTPDGWTVNATGATQTVVPVTPTYATPWATGNTFTYDKAGTTQVYALYGQNITSGWSVGDTIVFNGRLKVSGLSSATGFNLSLEVIGGAAPQFRPMSAFTINADYFFSAEMEVPTGATQLVPTLFLQDIGVWEVNALTVFNQTAADAIWTPGQQ